MNHEPNEHHEPRIPNYRELLCQKPNLCIELVPRIDALERIVHDISVNATTMGMVVNRLETVFLEREKMSTRLWGAVVALMSICVVHFCVFLIWMGTTTEKLASLKESDVRQSETISKINANTRP